MNKNQRGFTLVELVVVIIILGILAAIAAPRFANLQGSARAAALNGLRASVSSAATLANALQVASNAASNASVTMDGIGIAMQNGYPTNTGIGNAIQIDAGTFNTTGGSNIFQVTAAGTPANCQVTYNQSTTGAFPVITPVTTGC